MRLSILALAFFLASCSNNLRLASWNIRLDTPSDGVNQWPNRKERVASLIKKLDPDIFGVQEALPNQMADLAALLPGYDHCGVGRDDGKSAGEHSAIFFKRKKFSLHQCNTFWLSETPEVPGSKSWDAALTRICSWAELHEVANGTHFYVFNTHFDHIGKIARQQSMELISERIGAIAKDHPFVLMGDFNTDPTEEPYKVATDTSRWKIQDSYLAASKNLATTQCTWTGFVVENAECQRIDFIFASEKIKVKTYNTLRENDGQYYLSDHLPVVVELGL